MRVRRWEVTLAGTATLAVFVAAWVGAFHVATEDEGPRDIFGATAMLPREAPPVTEPPAFVLGATVERDRGPAVITRSTPTTTPGPSPTTTAPAPTTTTSTTPPETPPEEQPGPADVVDSVVDGLVEIVGGVVSGVLGLL